MGNLLRWLHLSDIHYTYKNYDSNRVRKLLLDYLKENFYNEIDYIFITGDITYQGEEYNKDLIDFFQKIIESINIQKDKLIIVPGNHDLTRNELREFAIEKVINSDKPFEKLKSLKNDTLNTIISAQDIFYEFYQNFKKETYPKESLHFIKEFNDCNIIHINTSWLCGLKDEEGHLLIDREKLQNVLENIDNSNKINIAIGHHTLECLEKMEQEKIKNLFADYKVDIYLSGHTHKPDFHFDIDNVHDIHYFTCGAGVEDGYAIPCVTTGEIDLVSGEGKVTYYKWYSEKELWYEYPVSRKSGARVEFLINKKKETASVKEKKSILNEYNVWLKNTTAQFTVVGLGIPLSIKNAWINLKVLSSKEIRLKSQKELKEIIASYHEWERLNHKENVYDAQDITQVGHQVVVIGGPGSGKSTLCKRAAHYLSGAGEIVIFIRLPIVLSRMEQGSTFDEAILEVAKDGLGIEVDALKRELIRVDCLIADGLDECDPKRTKVAELLSKWSIAHPNTRVIITTRPIGHDPAFFYEWNHVELLPLSQDSIEKHEEHLLKAIFGESEEYAKQLTKFREQLANNKVASIARRSPLLLGFMIQLSINGVMIENRRAALYKQILDLWLKNPERTNIKKIRDSTAIRALEIIGWILQNAAFNQELRSKRNLIKALGDTLASDLNITKLRSEELAEDCIDFWESRGILEYLQVGYQDAYVFHHLNIGEYVAGCYLAKYQENELKEFVKNHYQNPYWREVILLASGEGAVKLITETLIECEQTNEPDAKEIILAADALAESQYMIEFVDKVLLKLIKKLTSNIPIVAYEVAKAAVKLSYRSPKLGSDLTKPLLNHKQVWTRIAALRVYLACGQDYIEIDYLQQFIMDYPFQIKEKNKWKLSGGVGYSLQRENFSLCIDLLDNKDLTPEIIKKLETLFITGKVSVNIHQKISKKLMELGRIEVVKDVERKRAQIFNFNLENLSKIMREADLIFLNSLKQLLGDNYNLGKQKNTNYASLGKLSEALMIGECALDEWIEFAEKYNPDVYNTILNGVVVALDLTRDELYSEVICAIEEIEKDESIYLTSIIPRIPVEPDWEKGAKIIANSKCLVKAIGYSSSIIATVATLFLSWADKDHDISEMAKEILFTGKGNSIRLLSIIAESLWESETLNVILERLEGELILGCRWLYAVLPEISSNIEDRRIYHVLEKGLMSENLSIAKSVAESLKDYEISSLRPIDKIIKESLIHWNEQEIQCERCNIKIEGSSCPKCHIVPENPRAHLVRILSQMDMLDFEELLSLCKDVYNDVKTAAIEGLTLIFKKDKSKILESAIKVKEGIESIEVLNALFSIEHNELMSFKEVLIELSDCSNENVRYKFLEVLATAGWISDEEVISICEKKLSDEDELVRSRAILTLRKRRENSKK